MDETGHMVYFEKSLKFVLLRMDVWEKIAQVLQNAFDHCVSSIKSYESKLVLISSLLFNQKISRFSYTRIQYFP